MLTIGEFARETGLTAKALRLYDDLGLLAPADVDDRTGCAATHLPRSTAPGSSHASRRRGSRCAGSRRSSSWTTARLQRPSCCPTGARSRPTPPRPATSSPPSCADERTRHHHGTDERHRHHGVRLGPLRPPRRAGRTHRPARRGLPARPPVGHADQGPTVVRGRRRCRRRRRRGRLGGRASRARRARRRRPVLRSPRGARRGSGPGGGGRDRACLGEGRHHPHGPAARRRARPDRPRRRLAGVRASATAGWSG